MKFSPGCRYYACSPLFLVCKNFDSSSRLTKSLNFNSISWSCKERVWWASFPIVTNACHRAVNYNSEAVFMSVAKISLKPICIVFHRAVATAAVSVLPSGANLVPWVGCLLNSHVEWLIGPHRQGLGYKPILLHTLPQGCNWHCGVSNSKECYRRRDVSKVQGCNMRLGVLALCFP